MVKNPFSLLGRSFHRFRLKKWMVILAVVLLLAGGGTYGARKFMSQPAVGTSISSLPSASRTTPVELEQFDGTLFSFVHPMSYIEQITKPTANTTSLESRTFISSSMVSKVLTITISKLPSGKLEDESSYVMRTQNPDKYKIRPTVLKNEKVLIATNNDGQQYQQTAFWPHGDRLMIFTMTGAAGNAQAMTAEYQAMIGTISWR